MSGLVAERVVGGGEEQTVAATAEVVTAMTVQPNELAGRGLVVAVTAEGQVNPVRTAQLALHSYMNA
jgi:hypothetical protein